MIHKYPSVEENGHKGAERIAKMYSPGGEYYKPGMTVEIKHEAIPQWGSAIPGANNFGKTELGYMVIVDDHRPACEPIIK